MFILKKKQYTIKGTGKKIFQYKDGTSLHDSSQPSPLNPTIYKPHNSTRYINVVTKFRKISPNLANDDPNYERALPELYLEREYCCGCTACYAICPMSGPTRPEVAKRKIKNRKNLHIEYLISSHSGLIEYFDHTGAITMLPDEEGFLYPVVDAELCIRCYKCMSVCSFKKN